MTFGDPPPSRLFPTLRLAPAARPPLFERGQFVLHSGGIADWKIECDALTQEDWRTLALMLSTRLPPYGSVDGVPRGGLKLAKEMETYISEGPLLLVDDVWTTGQSMLTYRANRDAIGGVVFAREPVESWVTALFQMSPVPVGCCG